MEKKWTRVADALPSWPDELGPMQTFIVWVTHPTMNNPKQGVSISCRFRQETNQWLLTENLLIAQKMPYLVVTHWIPLPDSPFAA